MNEATFWWNCLVILAACPALWTAILAGSAAITLHRWSIRPSLDDDLRRVCQASVLFFVMLVMAKIFYIPRELVRAFALPPAEATSQADKPELGEPTPLGKVDVLPPSNISTLPPAGIPTWAPDCLIASSSEPPPLFGKTVKLAPLPIFGKGVELFRITSDGQIVYPDSIQLLHPQVIELDRTPEDRAVYPDRPWFRPVPACPEGPPAGWVGRCEAHRAWEGRR